MPHHPKPWFRPARNAWYVQLNGLQRNLGAHPQSAPVPRKRNGEWNAPAEVLDAYHKLMAAPPAPVIKSGSVIEVIDKFLDWCQENRKQKTYEWYRWRLQAFCNYLKNANIANLPVAQLRHFHIDEHLIRRPAWSSGMKHGACRAVQRAIRWAKKKGYVDMNPIADYEKPRPGKRKLVLSTGDFKEMLACVKRQPFKDLLTITWETGCRPQESLAVEARHVDLANSRWVFTPDESKGEEWPRIVYLNETALEITKRRMLTYPEGPLFRNFDGNPWVPYAVNCAFCRLQVNMGLRAMKGKGIQLEVDPALRNRARRKVLEAAARKHATKYSLYTIRHSWATHALARGIDALTVAILLGHRDPSTLAKVYQHLSQSPLYLHEQAQKVRA